MNRSFVLLLFLIGTGLCGNGCQPLAQQPAGTSHTDTSTVEIKSLHDFIATDLEGIPFDFSSLKGKKVMIVNTASECGYTPQYKDLQQLYEQYKDRNFVIVGFPSNDFGGQEPGSNEEIAAFCQRNYGVTFPMMAKTSVKGDDMHPVYRFLTRKIENGVLDSEVKWNFQKYLINEDGGLEKMIHHKTLPADPDVIAWIEKQ